MLSTTPQDRSVAADRTQDILDRLAREMEKAGNSYGLHPGARRLVLELAEHGQFVKAAASIRRTVARLDGPDLSVAPPPAPRPGPKPRPRPATPPILIALEGGGEGDHVEIVEDLRVIAELAFTMSALSRRQITSELRSDLDAAIAGLGTPRDRPGPRDA